MSQKRKMVEARVKLRNMMRKTDKNSKKHESLARAHNKLGLKLMGVLGVGHATVGKMESIA